MVIKPIQYQPDREVVVAKRQSTRLWSNALEVVGWNSVGCWAFFFSSLYYQQWVLYSGPSWRCNTGEFPIKKLGEPQSLRRSKLKMHGLSKKALVRQCYNKQYNATIVKCVAKRPETRKNCFLTILSMFLFFCSKTSRDDGIETKSKRDRKLDPEKKFSGRRRKKLIYFFRIPKLKNDHKIYTDFFFQPRPVITLAVLHHFYIPLLQYQLATNQCQMD